MTSFKTTGDNSATVAGANRVAGLLERDSEPFTRKSEWLIAVLLGSVGGVIAVLRLPFATWGTFYAEDGHEFVAGWVRNPSLDTLFAPYAGYQHLIPRAAASVVAQFPVELWAYVNTVAACGIVGVIGAISFIATRDLGFNRSIRIAIGLIPILTPLGAYEALGSTANIHWYIIYMMIWVSLVVPRSNSQRICYGLIAVAGALTEPQTVIFFPLLVFQLWRTRGANWPIVAGWVRRSRALGLRGRALAC